MKNIISYKELIKACKVAKHLNLTQSSNLGDVVDTKLYTKLGTELDNFYTHLSDKNKINVNCTTLGDLDNNHLEILLKEITPKL